MKSNNPRVSLHDLTSFAYQKICKFLSQRQKLADNCKLKGGKSIVAAFLVAVVLLPNVASARIRALTDYLANKDNMGFYIGSDGAGHTVTTTCSSLKGTNTKPNFKICSSQTINGKKCYYNCYCPSSYSQTCTSPMVGSDGPCDGKYVSCACPASYTLTCDGEGQVPSGTPCNGKYAACGCDASWVACAEGSGIGQSCTANGVTKYASCATVDEGNGAHYDGDGGELIFPPNNYTYFKGPLFEGQDNTQVVWDAAEAVGASSKAVKYARDFYVGSEDHENFGMGKWYLPALGEVMEMYGADWSGLVYDLKDSATDTVSKLKDMINDPSAEAWLDQYYKAENSDKIREAEDKLEAMGVDSLYRIEDEYIWTSNTVDAFPTPNGDFWVYVKRDKGIKLYPQSKLASVLPVTFLDIPIIDGILPKVGDVITLDLRYGDADNFDDPNDIAGIIYWRMRQPEETVRVRVRALTLTSKDLVGFNEGKENFAVPSVPDEPFTGVNLSDVSLCDAKFKWTEANCTRALNGQLGGDICDLDGEKKFTECITACPVMNDYEQFTGPLFDGMTNTQLMKEVYSSNPAIEILDWQPDWAGDLHEQLQASHWYIPSLGEALTMIGCDDISAFGGSLSNILGVKCDLDKANEFRDRIIVANDEMHKNYHEYPIYTSQEVSTEEFIGCDIGGCNLHPRNEPIEDWTVAALVEGDFAGAEYGDYLYADLHFSKDMEDDKYIGLIYWVSPDGSKARVVSRYLYLSSGGGATWTGTGDVNSDAMVDDPFECDTGNTGGSTSCSYTYTSSNCIFPREPAGAACTRNGTTYYDDCTCTPNIVGIFSGCQTLKNSLGYQNTQKMLAAGSQAAEYATNYHPSGIAANHSLFGAGNWFIYAGPNLVLPINYSDLPYNIGNWNNYAQCGVYAITKTDKFMLSCDTSKTNYRFRSAEGASSTLIKNQNYGSQVLVAPVLNLRCTSAQHYGNVSLNNYKNKLLYSDMSVGYHPDRTPIGYISSLDSLRDMTVVALDYGENLTWSDDVSTQITDGCGF